jgi:hypothetical protein
MSIGCNRVVQSASAGQEEHERKGDVKEREAGASESGCSHPEEKLAHHPLSVACECRQNLKELQQRHGGMQTLRFVWA